MTELQNIALIYESSVLLVEDARARLDYLVNNFTDRFLKAGAHPEAVVSCYVMSDFVDVVETVLERAKWSAFRSGGRTLYSLFKTIVERDPTPNKKYAPWIAIQLLKAVQSNNIDTFKAAAAYLLGWTNHEGPERDEDAYKMQEDLKIFERFKASFDSAHRDISNVSWSQLSEITQPVKDKIVEAELGAIPDSERVKLIEDFKGWSVIVPLTMRAARKYSLGTKWCTAAKDDEDNAFDEYNAHGPLFTFTNGKIKFQWWADPKKFFNALDGYDYKTDGPDMQFGDAVQLMDAANLPAEFGDIPYDVWWEAIRTPTSNQRIKAGQEIMHSWVIQMQPDESTGEHEDFTHGPLRDD